MSDIRKLADDLTTKAAIEAGKGALSDAVDDLLSSDEEKERKEAERKAKSKSRRNKLILYGVIGLLIVVGVLGFVASYWHWFLIAGLLGAGGVYGWSRLKKRFGKEKDDEPEEIAQEEAPKRVEIEPEDPEEQKAARLHAARARAEAEAVEEQAIDDELAAMKARLDD